MLRLRVRFGTSFSASVGAISVLPPLGGADIIEDIVRARPTLFFSQPAVLHDLLMAPDEVSLPSVRITVSAGERIPEHLPGTWLARFGHPILNGYGTTEVGHIFISQTLETCVSGSVGRPILGFDVDVVDSSGCPCETGKPGVLRVKGPAPVSSYFLG